MSSVSRPARRIWDVQPPKFVAAHRWAAWRRLRGAHVAQRAPRGGRL